MGFRNISAWAIRNPVPPIVLFIALTLMGVMAFMRMDVTQNPDIEFPGATVVISQPGAAPAELETQVAQKVEAAIRNINGISEINSSVREGSAFVFILFDIGTPIDRAVNDVRDAIANIRSDLPEGILEPQVQRVDISADPIAYISVEARDMTLEQLSWYTDNVVARRLRAVEGMAQVSRSGGVSREIRVILDPARMQSYGVTAAQINGQLRLNNLNAAGGRTEIAGAEQAVRVLGSARTAFELSEMQISLGGGRTVKLSDIADVRDSYAEQRSLATMDGRQVMSISLSRAKGASDVAVYDAAQEVLAELREETPGVEFRELFSSVGYTRGDYHNSIAAMIEGAVLAVVVVFLFLRDWRATVISALAIPLSAIPTFWFMDLMGFSLNQISLLALALVAGVLVDDAIVEIENIVRHMRMGKSAFQASIDAADEIGLAVVATTFSIVAVFLPVGLMPGLSGQFFKNFGLTVVIAVLISLAVARLITPMFAAYFLKAEGAKPHADSGWVHAYERLLRWTLEHRWKTMGFGAAALAATVAVFMSLPFTFQPTLDIDSSQIRVEMTPGTTLAQTQAVAQNIQTMLEEERETVSAAYADINAGSATIFLTLSTDRPMSSGEFETKWAPRLAAIPDARVSFASQNGGFSGRAISITLAGSDPELLERTGRTLVEQMQGVPELVAPRIAGDLVRPEITIRPRLDLAASLGVTTAALSQTIRLATLGDIDQNSARFSLSDRQIPIRVALSEESRQSLTTIENLPVPTANGGTVPLRAVAEVSFGSGPTVIQRANLDRRLTVGADLAINPATGEAFVSGEAQDKIDALPIMQDLPTGVRRLVIGPNRLESEMVTNFGIAVVAGVFLVLAVLVLLYHRLMPPFVNLGSLLLAPLGGGLGLLILGMPLSMPVLIGILMLLGIVAKNSILLVDFALEEMAHGVDKFSAILDAGRKRAQPIVMTTVAMVAGMVPTALSLSGDGAWRQPMGVTVIGGLIVSTMLTLLIVPASFSLAVGAEQRLGPRLRRRFLTYTPGDENAVTPPRMPPLAPQPAE